MQKAYDESSALLELARSRYGKGLIALPAVLEAERRLIDSDSARASARLGRLNNRIDLYLALGGHFEAGDWLLERARALDVEATAPERLLKGRHLLELGLRPGPQLGAILETCYAAQLEGEFSTLEGGLEYARRRWGPGTDHGADST